MTFIGKWTFTASSGQVVMLDDKTGQLVVGPAGAAAQQRLNAYGTTSMFVLQATGGKYVAWNGTAYVANQARDGAATWFALEDAGSGAWRVTDLGPKGTDTPYYWNGVTGPLARVAKGGSPPATTAFKQTVVTPGIADILQNGMPGANADLTWAYLGAVDLSPILTVQQADLTGANLAGANLMGVAFSLATISGADLTGAKMTGTVDMTSATMIGANLTGVDLTDAQMPSVTADRAILTDAKLIGVTLTDAKLPGAKLIRTKLSGFSALMSNVDFTGADLTDADFTEASVRTVTLLGTDLTGVSMSNPKGQTFVDLTDAKVDSGTNFTSAKLQYVDLSGKDLSNCVMTHVDLTGSKLDNVKLIGTELSYAVLDGCSMTGNIAMFGANFSNAQMTAARLPGAQMGSISLVFRIVNDTAGKQAYDAFLKALNGGEAKGVTDAFLANGVKLTAPVNVLGSTFAPGRAWTVSATGATYTVRLETTAGTDSLAVYQPAPAAILTNAYMRDAVLTSANLFNVRASGVQLYGTARLDGQVILEGVQFDSANLSGINLKQARLDGVNFGHATLTAAHFDGAWLTPDARGGQASLANANLQGATFTDAHLGDAILTDAAVSVARTEGSTQVEGVWLFSTRSTETLSAQLSAATKQISLPVAIAPQLVQGPVTDGVRNAFQKQGVTLSTNALAVVQDTGPVWTIADGANTYRVFQACDKANYVPALGVAKSATSLTVSFTIPLYLERDLRTGPVSDSVRKAFAAGGVTLGTDAKVTAATMNTDWQVVDTNASYDLWLGLNLDCALAISGRASIPAVLDFYANHSLPLSRRSTVTAGGTGRWAIDNDSNNPFNPITNYIKFNLVIETTGAPLDVYGSMLRVQRVGPNGTQIFDNVAVGITKLGQAELQPSTVCPNSNRTKVNIGEKLPFKQWMRARELPKPPWCIPSADGAFYCPPSGPGREPRETESAP
jgi:uncharacterized protein YjbI with pentapeptide repeats